MTEEEKKAKEERAMRKTESTIPREKLDELKESGVGGAMLAKELMALMRKENMPIPDEDREAGAQIMAWFALDKNTDPETGDVNLLEIWKDALEKWPKEKAKDDVTRKARCEANQPLVDALLELVSKAKRLGSNVVEPFKVNAYAGASENIRLLDYDVTKPGSGKVMLGRTVKGQKVGKVAGIGKGIAEMVDYWINNDRSGFGKDWEE